MARMEGERSDVDAAAEPDVSPGNLTSLTEIWDEVEKTSKAKVTDPQRALSSLLNLRGKANLYSLARKGTIEFPQHCVSFHRSSDT